MSAGAASGAHHRARPLAQRLRESMIRAAYAQQLRTWGTGYPGAAAMTAAMLDTTTEEVARVVAGAEQHMESPE